MLNFVFNNKHRLRKMKWIKWLGLSGVILLGCEINSFVKDLDKISSEPNWNPEFAAPIISGSFNLGDYVDNISDSITVYQDDEGVVVFEFEGSEISSDRADEMMAIPDQTFTENISFDAGDVTQLPIDFTITKSFNYDKDVVTEEGDQLASLVLKNTSLGIDVTGDLPVSGQIEVIFPGIEVGGQVVTRTYDWQYTPGFTGPNLNDIIDLNGAIVDLSKGGTTFNNFQFDINLTINYEGVPISPTNSVSIVLTTVNPQFQVAFGRFSQRTFNTPAETIDLGIFDGVDAVDFYLAEPQIDFNFRSSFGLPAVVGINTLVAYDSIGNSIAFTGTIVDDPVTVPGPPIDQIGTYSETDISINSSNSNIADVLAFLPYRIEYEIQGSVDEGAPGELQFVLDSSQVIGNYSVKLPLVGHVGEFSSEQELDFDSLDQDFIENAKLIIKTTNGLPLTVNVELMFVDVNDNVLVTLFEDTNILNPGEIDANGIVITPTETTIEETLSLDDLEALKACSKIIMKSTLFTGETGTEDVKIRMEDEVKVNVFIQAQLGI